MPPSGKRKLHIRVQDARVSDAEALACVAAVVNIGRVSDDGKKYCAITTFKSGRIVAADTTSAGADSFWVGTEAEHET
jgi:hypothetical protein